MEETKIVLKEITEEKLKDAMFISGFRTLGEVGYLSIRHLILSRKMKRIGFVITKYLRDVTFLDDYGIATPFELFYDEEFHTVALLNHLLPFQREWSEFSHGIVKWLKKIRVKDAVLVGGLDKRYKDINQPIKWMKTSKSNIELNYPLLNKQLIVVGPLALFTVYAEIEDIPATVLLPYADRERLDPAAAAIAVETLNHIVGFKVDTKELYEDAKKIEQELQRQLEMIQKELSKSGVDRHYM
ncbi:proteasome assembly chaperone family protein [Metallosphaera tengchongensis]|uniref:Proteasome assembly chaperone family protein n=1 Tax=Metallosphaera tengchongensis TaxID=1532350 RepID=A0A6N0NVJ8_9CREN|nr:PAC2 family protein [Metallosphaera tengchongensis]QKQ99872.1 proteasome assembly chaperone family protein [Metallosphaera tengchongensis]